jgi:hypothetical protein
MEDGSIKPIPDWHKKNLVCHFCGETRSVKYTMKVLVIDPLLGTDTKEVCCCNKCALLKR